jgi:transposase
LCRSIRGGPAMTLRVRAVSDEEREALGGMARSRTLGAGLVRRAQIVVHALEGLKAPEIGARMGLCGATVRHWLKRFNTRGLAGLEEDVRSGRPPTYSAEQRSAVINAALTRPAELGLPFACWTLDRLVAYLSERGIAMRRSRISEIFLQEGLKWRHEETWFGARVDPDFAQKRGRSSSSTRRHRPAASSSASTRWGRKPARATQASSS